jgi:hypothetical protein
MSESDWNSEDLKAPFRHFLGVIVVLYLLSFVGC